MKREFRFRIFFRSSEDAADSNSILAELHRKVNKAFKTNSRAHIATEQQDGSFAICFPLNSKSYRLLRLL